MKCLVQRADMMGTVFVEDINLSHFIKNPSNRPKDKLPMWRFITLKEDAPKKACTDNYDTIHTLILEFDKGVKICEIEKLFNEYSFAIHTTSNHTADNHRFRIIIPLDMEYSEYFWRLLNVKNAMKLKIPCLDNTCFVNYQCIPALPANPADYYYKINNGRRFGYEDIRKIVEELELNEKLELEMSRAFRQAHASGSREINRDAYKAKVDQTTLALIRDLPGHENGSRYSEFCSVMGKLLNCKYPDGEHIYSEYEIKQTLKNVYWDNSLEKTFKSFARRRK